MDVHKKHSRLSVTAWAEIEEIYAIGAATIRELSEKYGPTERTIKRHMAKAGIIKGSRLKELVSSAKERILAEAVHEPENFARRFNKHNENSIKITTAIQNITAREISRLDDDPYGASIRLKALQSAMQIIAQTQKVQRKCFGADDGSLANEELPELIIREYTQTELEELNAKHIAARSAGTMFPLSATIPERDSDIIDTTSEPMS